MKRITILLLIMALMLTGCTSKQENLIPEGEYLIYQINNQQETFSREEIDEQGKRDIDYIYLHVFSNNEVVISYNSDEKYNAIITENQLINKDDKNDALNYEYKDNKIIVENPEYDLIFIAKDKLNEPDYDEMVGHYEPYSAKNAEGVSIDESSIQQIKGTDYIDIYGNRKLQLTIDNNTHFMKINSKHIFNENNNKDYFDYNYENGMLTLHLDPGEMTYKRVKK